MSKQLRKRFFRKGQIGQSIVILALGMVALLGFVGITTDISILFVRYSTLRRAVDSAAIAAAGQMRQDRSLATVDMTARQFVEFHGLDPSNVWVESCHNQPRLDTDPGRTGLQLAPASLYNLGDALESAISGGTNFDIHNAYQAYFTALVNYMNDEGEPPTQRTLDELTDADLSRDIWLADTTNVTSWNNYRTDAALARTRLENEAFVIGADREICTGDQRKLVRVTAQIESPTVFLRLFGWRDITLEASAISETAVMDVVIVMDVSESMLTETTYDDWGTVNLGTAYIPPRLENKAGSLIADTNTILADMALEGWLPELSNDIDWRLPDQITEYAATTIYTTPPTEIPPAGFGTVLSGFDEETWYEAWFWGEHLLGNWQQEVNDRLYWLEHGQSIDGGGVVDLFSSQPATPNPNPEDEANQFYQVRSFVPQSVQTTSAAGANQGHPREACRVRFYPYSTRYSMTEAWPAYIDTEGNDTIAELYATDPNIRGGVPLTNPEWPGIENYDNPTATQAQFNGFVPTYNYYACCNDPTIDVDIDNNSQFTITDPGTGLPVPLGANLPIPVETTGTELLQGDWDFSDLICQPFKQARDATREFLERIDFLRGDRVAFVTFDRSAFLIDPDGVIGSQTHMIETLEDARDVLDTFVGVRAEPNYYLWDDEGGWEGFSAGFDSETGGSIPVNFARRNDNPADPDPYNPTPTDGNLPEAYNYPAFGNCFVQNSILAYPQSVYATRNATPGDPLVAYAGNPAIQNFLTPPIYDDSDWITQRTNRGLTEENSYEMWAMCRGTNMGAALREAGGALTNAATSRREGTVWVMIMLSDGAAAASDPVRAEGFKRAPINPYVEIEEYNWRLRNDPVPSRGIYGSNGSTSAEYGAYGLCPFGRIGAPTRLGELITGNSDQFPWCADQDPFTRHFCLPNDGRPVGMANPSNPASNNSTNSFGTGFSPNAVDRCFIGSVEPFGSYTDEADYETRVPRFEATGSPTNPAPDDLCVGRPIRLPPPDVLGYPSFDDYPGGETAYIRDQNVVLGNYFEVDIGDFNDPGNNCDPLYDVEDYARDWADYISGVDEEGSVAAVLPTIFTIGFGLNFEQGAGTCEDNLEDCLGEELLRYIADAGDNFQIDNDIHQDLRDGAGSVSLTGDPDILPNPARWAEYQVDTTYPTLDGSVENWGPKDPCEAESLLWRGPDVEPVGNLDGRPDDVNGDGRIDPVDVHTALDNGDITLETRTPGDSCGNYYNAPSLTELQQVFDDIASRMFTRIAG